MRSVVTGLESIPCHLQGVCYSWSSLRFSRFLDVNLFVWMDVVCESLTNLGKLVLRVYIYIYDIAFVLKRISIASKMVRQGYGSRIFNTVIMCY